MLDIALHEPGLVNAIRRLCFWILGGHGTTKLDLLKGWQQSDDGFVDETKETAFCEEILPEQK